MWIKYNNALYNTDDMYEGIKVYTQDEVVDVLLKSISIIAQKSLQNF